jgi:flagellar transcriptional activator FlhD
MRNYFKFEAIAHDLEWKMKRSDYQEEITELNLAYLMLAQKMLREDRETAMFRLGIGAEVADLLEGLTSARLVKMASGQMLLPVFRFDDTFLAGLLAGEGRDPASSRLHAAILAAGKPPVGLDGKPAKRA